MSRTSPDFPQTSLANAHCLWLTCHSRVPSTPLLPTGSASGLGSPAVPGKLPVPKSMHQCHDLGCPFLCLHTLTLLTTQQHQGDIVHTRLSQSSRNSQPSEAAVQMNWRPRHSINTYHMTVIPGGHKRRHYFPQPRSDAWEAWK